MHDVNENDGTNLYFPNDKCGSCNGKFAKIQFRKKKHAVT